MTDKQFINQFSAVLIILLSITVVILIIARAIAHQPQKQDLAMKHIVEERLKPIGEVNVGGIPGGSTEISMTNMKDKQMATATPANEKIDSKQIYETVCATCHATGLINAPIYGDKAAWAPRLGDVEQLYTHAIKGKGAMPAKGGRIDLSDETIKATVDYMLKAVR